MNWYMMALSKYAQFDGRSRRMEYWVFTLINSIIGLVIWLVAFLPAALQTHADNPVFPIIGGGLLILFSLAMLLPGLAVAVRRLHDTGKSGWWFLVTFVPLVGTIILLVFMFTDSQPGPNQYGPNPKELGPPGEFIAATPRI